MAKTTHSPPTVERVRARRADILRLAARYGVSNVRIVGSVARGEATAAGDVDLLITVPPSCSVFDLVGLWLDMQELLGCAVSLIPDNAADEAFLREVQEDAIPLWPS